MIGNFFVFVQLFFSIIIGIYFLNLLRNQQGNKASLEKESEREYNKLKRLREIKLSEPLSEKTRPTELSEIVGQEQGILALKAALCGPFPQHIIIYGPPGIGKTAAARVVLEEAKKCNVTPFKKDAKFIETDATTLRFDERGIADPLIGSVHDPIYQGAGAYGNAGIPQPKAGAVTKAHGGVLFIDEIGELHPIQINKLLKVLEDRKVYLESAYYSSSDKNIPIHIHEIFNNGLPADFRLIGATTRMPEEIPPAIRSRCTEIFFIPLFKDEIKKISKNAATKGNFAMQDGVCELISNYATNGREAVNIVQIAGGIAQVDNRNQILLKDIEWVIEFGKYSPRLEKKVEMGSQIGVVNGLAVVSHSFGAVMEIEAVAEIAKKGKGELVVTGICESEETEARGNRLKRKSTAKASVENMITVMDKLYNQKSKDYDIHINFPGGMQVDGPSAGIAIFTALYSAINKIPIDNETAMTGEISIKGRVLPVGGVIAKVEAAKQAGVKKVLIPKDNMQSILNDLDIEVIAVETVDDVLNEVFGIKNNLIMPSKALIEATTPMTALGK